MWYRFPVNVTVHTRGRYRQSVTAMSRVNTVRILTPVLLAVSAILSSAVAEVVLDHSSQLDPHGRFALKWGYNTTHVTFETHVHTAGWVGFGVASRAAMSPGDVCIGYVSRGQRHFADYHTRGHSAVRDAHADWHLERLTESAGWTVMRFHRRLNTHDAYDIPIQPGQAMHVIYAAASGDPHNTAHMGHHNLMSGVKTITLVPASSTVG